MQMEQSEAKAVDNTKEITSSVSIRSSLLLVKLHLKIWEFPERRYNILLSQNQFNPFPVLCIPALLKCLDVLENLPRMTMDVICVNVKVRM